MGFAQTIQGFPVPLLATTLPPVGKSAPLERRSRTCRHSSPSDRLATLKSLQSQGKNYAAGLEGRQDGRAGYRPCLWGTWGSTVTTGSVEASPLASDDRADYGLAACCCCSCSCRCRRSRSCSSCCCRSCSCRFLASKEGC